MRLQRYLSELMRRAAAVHATRAAAADALATYERGETPAAPLCEAVRATDAAYLRHCAMDRVAVEDDEGRAL